jgi:hypothetical protein
MAGYCKLCTILLSQGQISADLERFVLDSIGTEEEKEDFPMAEGKREIRL